MPVSRGCLVSSARSVRIFKRDINGLGSSTEPSRTRFFQRGLLNSRRDQEVEEPPVRMLSKLAIAVLVFSASTTLMAQWPKYVPAGVPTGADGKIDVNAPTPRAADGHPDLSGVWEISRDPNAPPPAQGRGRGRGQGGGSPFGNIGNNMPGQKAPYQPWAEELVKRRMADNSKDNPDAHCLPMGIAQLNAHLYPRKILQTPKEVLLIYEASGTTVREVFMDGRPLPKKDDLEPWYNAYSVGHWDGDTLVIA